MQRLMLQLQPTAVVVTYLRKDAAGHAKCQENPEHHHVATETPGFRSAKVATALPLGTAWWRFRKPEPRRSLGWVGPALPLQGGVSRRYT